MSNITIGACYVRALLKYCEDSGIQRSDLLKQHSIPLSMLSSSHARITGEKLADLQRAVIIGMQDEMLGYLADPVLPRTWDLLCHWLIGAVDIRDAFARVCQFFQITGTGFRVYINEQNKQCSLVLNIGSGDVAEPFVYELIFFSLHRLFCWLSNRSIRLEKICLPFDSSPNEKEYHGLFLGSEVQFKCRNAEMIFNERVLEYPVKRALPELRRFLIHPFRWMICETTGNPSWTERVRNAINQAACLNINLPQVADQLDIHPKKLMRTLNAENTAFLALKQEVLRDRAIMLMQNRAVPVREVSEQLGFSETSAFSRAFKTWTGISPHRYRRSYLTQEYELLYRNSLVTNNLLALNKDVSVNAS